MDRDTNKYILTQGGKTVYVGITNNMERREAEHRNEGIKFDNMQKVGRMTTRDAAGAWEQQTIQQYKEEHRGHLPRYNQNDSGK